jgi:hypothetical protein
MEISIPRVFKYSIQASVMIKFRDGRVNKVAQYSSSLRINDGCSERLMRFFCKRNTPAYILCTLYPYYGIIIARVVYCIIPIWDVKEDLWCQKNIIKTTNVHEKHVVGVSGYAITSRGGATGAAPMLVRALEHLFVLHLELPHVFVSQEHLLRLL